MGRSRINFPGRPSSRHLLADTAGAEGGGGGGGGSGEPRAVWQPPVRLSVPAWATGSEDEATGRVGDGKGLQAAPSAEARRLPGGEDLRSATEVTSQAGTLLSEMVPFKSRSLSVLLDNDSTAPQTSATWNGRDRRRPCCWLASSGGRNSLNFLRLMSNTAQLRTVAGGSNGHAILAQVVNIHRRRRAQQHT